jgi:hypothetical protein
MGEGKGGGEKGIALSHPIRSPLSRRGWRGNEKGIALVMVLILAAITLAIMAGLIYMITAGTQISGMQKRYKTALDAGFGGADITYQIIGLRGETSGTVSLLNDLSAICPDHDPTKAITTPNTCVTLSTNPACTAIGSYTGLASKLNLPTSCWSGCDSSLTINTGTSTSYDMRFDLGTSPFPTYRAFAKIVDTVVGNSGGDEGLLKSGVVSANTGEVTVVSRPYLYTIEVDAENQVNPSERAKLSILYQY